MQLLSRYALQLGLGCGLVLGFMALPAAAQNKLPAPVAPPAIGALPAPIQPTQPQTLLPAPVPAHPAPATDPVPVIGAPSSTAIVAPIVPDAASKTAAFTTPLLVAQWRVGKSTPQEAWDKGLLTVEDLIYILNHSIDYWGGFYWEKDVDLRREIVTLLVRHGGDRIAKPETLSPFVRLWLADYYESIGDARTLPLCEGILNEIKTPVKGEGALAFQAVERIGWYYRDQGEYERGAQAWLRMMNYHADVGWWTPDAYIEAARLFYRAGNSESAQGLYAKVLQYGDSSFVGLAVLDRTQWLLRSDKNRESQQLLQELLDSRIGKDTPNRLRVVLLAELAFSYYKLGDFPNSRQFGQQAVDLYKIQDKPQHNDGLESYAEIAFEVLSWVGKWEQGPFVCDSQEVHLKTENDKEPILRHITVYSYAKIPLTVTCDAKNIKCDTALVPQDTNFFVATPIEIQILPQEFDKQLDSKIIVKSPAAPNFQIPVLVHVDGESSINLSPRVVFFGFIKPKVAESRSCRISTTEPSQIVQINTDNPIVQAEAATRETATQHVIRITLTPKVAEKKPLNGNITVKTDKGEVVNIPYSAFVEER